MNVTLSGVKFQNGTPVRTKVELTQRSDGTWYAPSFGNALQEAYDTSRSGASQTGGTGETGARIRLTDQELAELASKYDPSNMTQDQYDAFLDELVEKGALSRSDALRLGYKGFRLLDIDLESFATRGVGGGGMAYVTRAENYGDELKQSLEDVCNDLKSWLELMLARQYEGTDAITREGIRQRSEAMNALSDIVRRMEAYR